MRFLGLDYGDKYVGVAVSDGLGLTASPLTVIKRTDPTNLTPTIEEIKKLVMEYEVNTIILGNPINMDSTEGFRVDSTRFFKEKLASAISVPIILMDERLSSVAAQRVLDEGNIPKEEQKEYEDKIAASIILQNYLDGQ